MAAATLLNGPVAGLPYSGFLHTGGFSPNIQFGRAAFPTTDSTCTMPLLSGGLTGTPIVFVQFETVADKTIHWTISGTTITFIRTDATSGATFSFFILFVL